MNPKHQSCRINSVVRLVPMVALLVGCADTAPDVYPHFGMRTAMLSEEVRIDGHTEDFVPIGSVAVRGDGTIAFSQSQDALVRFYSTTGSLLGAFGGRGEGPGEFQNPLRLGWIADTLWVYDGRLNRITFVTSTLELAGVESNIPRAPRTDADEIRSPDFTYAVLRSLSSERSAYVQLDESAIGLMTLDGVLEEVLLQLPAAENAIALFSNGGSAILPFGNWPAHTIASDGRRIAVVMAALDGQFAGTFALAVVDAEGNEIVDGRYAFEGEPIPQAVGDSIMAARIESALQYSPSAAAEIRQQAYVPPVYPPITGILVGSDYTIWVEQRSRTGQRPYYVVDPQGAVVGTLVVPERSRLVAAGPDWVWVSEADALGVESLVRYGVAWN